MNLNSSLGLVKGVGEKTLEKFHASNIYTVGDLLKFFPRKYEDFATLTNLSEITSGKVFFKAWAEKVSLRRVRRGMTITEATLTDGKEKIRAIWFNQPYRAAQLKTGDEFFFSGQFEFSYNRYQLTNSSVIKREDLPKNKTFSGKTGEIVPIYRQIKGLKTDLIRKILSELRPLMKILPETLPESVITSEKLISRAQAIEWVHFPGSADEFNAALDRLAFEEIFEIIFAAKLNKIDNEKLQAPIIKLALEDIKSTLQELPFTPTNDQRRAIWEIIQDMNKNMPMNRLLQGDVGSGKTLVAIISSLNAIKSGFQVAVLAPTEVLASQLANSFSDILTSTNISIGFLSGSTKQSSRKIIHEKLTTGKIDILIGTHAIIQDKIQFRNLGLAIIDEQHRFGVKQRQKLIEKSSYQMPHLLTMTATPIPRSLQLTLFGDLSVSILREKPNNRQQIETKILSPTLRHQAIKKIKSELSTGRQAFVIVPAISENSNNEIKSVETEFIRLKKDLRPFRVNFLHGQMRSEEKDQIMTDFLAKKFDVLLSTTVIEVGIDIPNASSILIENSERFGLSQLHQLRGRVGRGKFKSYCFLITSSNTKPPARLLEIEKSDDGFYLAEKDLGLRGAGEIYGTAQSGELNLEFASLGDIQLISRVQKAVENLYQDSRQMPQYIKNHSAKLKKYQRLTILN